MSTILPAVEIAPSRAPQAGTVIWLHGLGADGHDFEPIAPLLGLSNVRFVFPHAPSMPVTINGGMLMPAWYDILTLSPGPLRENLEHVKASATLVQNLIDREIERGVAPKNIVLAGFSQGAAMALYVGLRYPKALAGIMALSGYLLAPETTPQEASDANTKTPILICHGTQDPVVPHAGGKASHDFLAQTWPERSIEWRDFPMGHQVCDEELHVIARWLQQRFQ